GGAEWFARGARGGSLGGSRDGGRTGQERICSGAGEQAVAWQEARAAAKFLPPAACAAALDGVPDTLAKIAASRAPCNQVTEKLCAEFGADSPICGMVREKAPMFPPERCEEMLSSYDLVVRELRMLQRGGLPMMSPPASSPPGHEHPSSDPHGHGHDGHSH